MFTKPISFTLPPSSRTSTASLLDFCLFSHPSFTTSSLLNFFLCWPSPPPLLLSRPYIQPSPTIINHHCWSLSVSSKFIASINKSSLPLILKTHFFFVSSFLKNSLSYDNFMGQANLWKFFGYLVTSYATYFLSLVNYLKNLVLFDKMKVKMF